MNESMSFFWASSESVGNTAIANETPIIPTGKKFNVIRELKYRETPDDKR